MFSSTDLDISAGLSYAPSSPQTLAGSSCCNDVGSPTWRESAATAILLESMSHGSVAGAWAARRRVVKMMEEPRGDLSRVMDMVGGYMKMGITMVDGYHANGSHMAQGAALVGSLGLLGSRRAVTSSPVTSSAVTLPSHSSETDETAHRCMGVGANSSGTDTRGKRGLAIAAVVGAGATGSGGLASASASSTEATEPQPSSCACSVGAAGALADVTSDATHSALLPGPSAVAAASAQRGRKWVPVVI